MYDLHTHILPGMDDGAGSIEQSIAMLDMEIAQGVDAVALTPHFYRTSEHIDEFLRRRAAAMAQLTGVLSNKVCPKLILGAEVAWMPGMADWDSLEALCYTDTNVLLVELPFTKWNDEMFRQLYNLEIRRGITPMIAHIDRYFGIQEKRYFSTLFEMEFPVQISSMSLQGVIGGRRAMKILSERNAILISDCHSPTERPPNMGVALKIIQKKLGLNVAKRISSETENVLFY